MRDLFWLSAGLLVYAQAGYGLLDHLRHATPAVSEPAEGTR